MAQQAAGWGNRGRAGRLKTRAKSALGRFFGALRNADFENGSRARRFGPENGRAGRSEADFIENGRRNGPGGPKIGRKTTNLANDANGAGEQPKMGIF